MKTRCVPALVFAVVSLLAGVAADAGVSFNVDLNPFGWGAPPPPVVYEPRGYEYSAPPVVYYGHGHWGDHDRRHHDWHDRHHHHDDGHH